MFLKKKIILTPILDLGYRNLHRTCSLVGLTDIPTFPLHELDLYLIIIIANDHFLAQYELMNSNKLERFFGHYCVHNHEAEGRKKEDVKVQT
jgi:hypothetical protein